MKKLLLVIALVAVGMSSASAQAVWGARVGLSKPTLTESGGGEEGGKWEGKFGLELGPVLYYNLKNNWYINSGAMFSIRTLSDSYSGYGYNYTIDLTLMYLDIPVYAGYAFKIGKAALYAQAGPYVGFKVSENWKVSNSGDFEEGDIEPELTSLNFGLGAMVGINLNRFKIELGYQNGLANILKKDAGGDDFSVKLNSIFLGVSYVF